MPKRRRSFLKLVTANAVILLSNPGRSMERCFQRKGAAGTKKGSEVAGLDCRARYRPSPTENYLANSNDPSLEATHRSREDSSFLPKNSAKSK